MNKSIEKAINEQINAEIFSGYLYLSMAAHFDAEGLPGFANWMKMQAQEEMAHAMKFYDYVNERGGKVVLKKIDQPENKFDSPLHIFQIALEHEKKVTDLINKLYELALKEKDYAFQSFLKWYIDEQVEEEATAMEIIDKIKLAGDKGHGLYMLDKDLANRKFNAENE